MSSEVICRHVLVCYSLIFSLFRLLFFLSNLYFYQRISCFIMSIYFANNEVRVGLMISRVVFILVPCRFSLFFVKKVNIIIKDGFGFARSIADDLLTTR